MKAMLGDDRHHPREDYSIVEIAMPSAVFTVINLG